MIAIAIAIKLDSRGPVFFRQLRVGRARQRFHVFKFRTMVPDAEAMKDSLRRPQRGAGGAVQDRRRPARHPGRAAAAQDVAGRAAPAAERRHGAR